MWASAPTRDEGCGGVWSPRPTGASQVVRSERADVPKAWLPPTKFRVEIWGVGQVVVPYGSITGSAQQTGRREQRGAVNSPWKALGLRNS